MSSAKGSTFCRITELPSGLHKAKFFKVTWVQSPVLEKDISDEKRGIVLSKQRWKLTMKRR